MIPILHHNDTCSVHIKNLNRGQKWFLSFSSFTINNWLEADWWSYNDIWGIKIGKIDDFFLFGKYFDTDSEEVIFIILIFFNFSLVLYNPLIGISSFVFFSLILILILNFNLLILSHFLIFHKLFFEMIKNCFSITNIWSDDEIFGVCESFWFFVLFESLDTVFLMFIHVSDNYFSEILNCFFFIIFDMNIINVTVDYFLCSLILYSLWSLPI